MYHHKTFILVALFLTAIFSTISANAESLSTAVHYQGFLISADGTSANGCYDFEAELFDGQAPGGTAVAGPSAFSGINVDGGFFDFEVDFGTIFMGDQYYLEIRYRSCGAVTYTTLSPRQPLHAAPNSIYAIKAGEAVTAAHATFADDADTLDGLDSTAFLPSTGGWSGDDLGVGISSPSCRLHVVDELDTLNDAAICIDFATDVSSSRTLGLGIQSVSLDLKGEQVGIEANTSADGATAQSGRAIGRLASSTAWVLRGDFQGVTGVGRAESLDNADNSTLSRSVGGLFVGGSEESMTLSIDSVGTYFVGGTLAKVDGTINGPAVCSNAVAGVIGIDESTGTAPSFAGHFTGDGYFSGNVAIGACDATNIITVAMGSATDPIADAWTTYSSKRYKNHVITLDGALAKVLQMRGVSFQWNTDGREDIGFIAEEVGEVVPEIVTYEDNGVDAQGLDYTRLVPLLVEAIKEQQSLIDHLLARSEISSNP